MADELESLIYRYLAEYGPSTAAAIIAGLGGDAERISETMARLLDAHRLMVAGMTRNGDPLYDVAIA